MILIQEPRESTVTDCHYLEKKEWKFEYFFALAVTDQELNNLLEQGWRKFGAYFFRPKCGDCTECVPIRVPVRGFQESKSQRRAVKKGSSVVTHFGPLRFFDEIFEIYKSHGEGRFETSSSKDEFIQSFYTQSCSSLQGEYYLDGELIAIGFLDRSTNALSSVYFAFKPEYDYLSLGTLSAIREIDLARKLSLEYYYLGYYIDDNKSMAYKNRFRPNEKFNWEKGLWCAEPINGES